MRVMDVFQLSFNAFKERKVRSALTIIMVVIGASLVTALRGMTAGTYHYVVGQFSLLGANVIIVLPSSPGFKMTQGVKERVITCSGVVDAVPFIQQTVLASVGGESKRTFLVGIEQSKLPLIFPSLSLEEGELVPSHDSTGILLGNLIAYPTGESKPFATYGSSVTISYVQQQPDGRFVQHKKTFRVRGVLNYIGSSALFIPVDRMVSISLSAANTLFERGGAYDGMFLVAETQERVEKVVEEIRRLYPTNVEIYSSKTIIQTAQNIMGSIRMMMSGVAVVSLLVAAVGTLASLYTAVLERTKEIGLLKALGMKNRFLVTLFLNEALIIGLIGGAVGNIAGVGLAHILAILIAKSREASATELITLGYAPPIFTVDIFLTVLAFTVALSVVSGMYPAWRAAGLDPVVALRKE